MAHAINFTAWCLVSDEMNSNIATAEVLVVSIWRAAEYCLVVERQTQSVAWKRSRPLLTSHKKHLEQIVTGCLWIPTIDRVQGR